MDSILRKARVGFGRKSSPPKTMPQPAAPPVLTTLDVLKLRVMRVLLALGTCSLLSIWYFEASSSLIIAIDRVAYPVMATLLILYLIILQVVPAALTAIEYLSFATVAGYAVIYMEITYFGLAPTVGAYSLATLVGWFPFIYVSGFIFFETRSALLVSALVYLTLLVPTLVQWIGNRGPFRDAESSAVLLNMVISHPVYLVALWGVSLLKEHFIRARAHADSMSLAANLDPLTGVANRRSIVQVLEHGLDSGRGGAPVAVILFDIDRFKEINDTQGHGAGDELLIEMVQHLRPQLRASGLLGRWGGDEFIVVETDAGGTGAQSLAERLRELIERHFRPRRVTASFGVAVSVPGDKPVGLVERADGALYRAKQQGRNRVEVAVPDYDEIGN